MQKFEESLRKSERIKKKLLSGVGEFENTRSSAVDDDESINPIRRKIGREFPSYFLCIRKVNNFVPKPPILNILCHKACSVL